MTPASHTMCNQFCETDSKLTVQSLSWFIQIPWAAVCIAWRNLNKKDLTLIILVSPLTAWPPLKLVGIWIKACPSVRHDVTGNLFVDTEWWCNSALCFKGLKGAWTGIIRAHYWRTILEYSCTFHSEQIAYILPLFSKRAIFFLVPLVSVKFI